MRIAKLVLLLSVVALLGGCGTSEQSSNPPSGGGDQPTKGHREAKSGAPVRRESDAKERGDSQSTHGSTGDSASSVKKEAPAQRHDQHGLEGEPRDGAPGGRSVPRDDKTQVEPSTVQPEQDDLPDRPPKDAQPQDVPPPAPGPVGKDGEPRT